MSRQHVGDPNVRAQLFAQLPVEAKSNNNNKIKKRKTKKKERKKKGKEKKEDKRFKNIWKEKKKL